MTFVTGTKDGMLADPLRDAIDSWLGDGDGNDVDDEEESSAKRLDDLRGSGGGGAKRGGDKG